MGSRTLLDVVPTFGLQISLRGDTWMEFTIEGGKHCWWLNAINERDHQVRDSRQYERPSECRENGGSAV